MEVSIFAGEDQTLVPIKKWLFQYSIALPLVFLLLAAVQYAKGRSLEYAIEFGLVWSFISVAVFAARRAYSFRQNIHCALCNDLPKKEE